MTHKTQLKDELEKSAQELRTLRDQIRVQAHLGKLDAQKRWRDLEPRLEATLRRAAEDVSEATRKAVSEAIEAVKKLS